MAAKLLNFYCLQIHSTVQCTKIPNVPSCGCYCIFLRSSTMFTKQHKLMCKNRVKTTLHPSKRCSPCTACSIFCCASFVKHVTLFSPEKTPPTRSDVTRPVIGRDVTQVTSTVCSKHFALSQNCRKGVVFLLQILHLSLTKDKPFSLCISPR